MRKEYTAPEFDMKRIVFSEIVLNDSKYEDSDNPIISGGDPGEF